MIHKLSIYLFLAYIVVAVVWDIFVIARGNTPCTWCQAAREVNAQSDGLLALCSIALWIHIFAVQWLPNVWRHN